MVRLIGHRRHTTTAHLIAGMPKQVLTGSSNRRCPGLRCCRGDKHRSPSRQACCERLLDNRDTEWIAQHNESPRPDNATAG